MLHNGIVAGKKEDLAIYILMRKNWMKFVLVRSTKYSYKAKYTAPLGLLPDHVAIVFYKIDIIKI